MEIKKDIKEDKILLHLQGELNIYSVSYLKNELIDVLKNYTKIAIDLSHVDELDTAGFQLLIALKRSALERGAVCKLLGHSSKVLRLLALYGGVGLLGDKIRLTNDEMDNFSFRYGLKKQNLEAGKISLI